MKYQIVHLSFVKIQTFIYVIVYNELLPYHLSMNRHIPILKVELPSMITGQAHLHPNRHPRFNVGISENRSILRGKNIYVSIKNLVVLTCEIFPFATKDSNCRKFGMAD